MLLIRKCQAYFTVHTTIMTFDFLTCCDLTCFRLILSGNPLDCVCDNLWIKLRLQEDADGQELKCIDERRVIKSFATLTPPDCGNVKPSHNK